jgi:methionyl-tRNA formyltransferase
MKLQPSEVKSLAVAHDIPVLQPPTLRTEEAQAALRDLEADVFVVVAYGLILPKAVLDIPPLGCINVHFSLLPRWRGAAPVQWAILEGDAASGVAIMQMDPGMDTGPVLEMVEERISPDDTSGTLAERLAVLGSKLIPEVVGRLHEITLEVQPEGKARMSGAEFLRGYGRDLPAVLS